MQISKNLLRVIFMLSTIVAVTDCCSSRILFLKEQTFNIIQQHKMQQYQQYDDGRQPLNEKYEQHVYSNNGAGELINNNKHHININTDDETTSEDQTAEASGKDRPPPQSKGGGRGLEDIKPFGDLGKQISELLLADVAKQNKKHPVENPGYQLIDFYQSIMDNVLSFACTGQFLTDFCLNGGRCFRVPMGNQSLFSCECADGYVGERCESKSVNGVFVPSSALDQRKPKILTARVVFSFPMLIFLTVIYLFFGMLIVFKCQPPFRAKYTPQTSSSSSRAAGLLFT
ncbi:Protein gurken [Lucilia cuprina]|uniref:Protein gurken n=2 Tax=Lucilia cuprina TaxID=7375 RepID=A0A0L0CBY6_LUCCU|nr:Protein gurken [Lucilia cuprina]